MVSDIPHAASSLCQSRRTSIDRWSVAPAACDSHNRACRSQGRFQLLASPPMEFESAVLFSGWLPIVRVLVVGTSGYVFLLLVLKAVGPRSLAKTNLFDFIILVSIGSVYGRILTASDVALVEALVAYALVVSMHYVVSWLRCRFDRVATLLDVAPILLFYQGRYLEPAMRHARVRQSDLDAAAREKGFGSLSDIAAIVLEADGELSILRLGEEPLQLVEENRGPPTNRRGRT